MPLSLTVHRPNFIQGVARILGALAAQRRLQPMRPLHARQAPTATAHQPAFDAHRLDRTGLLAELLAPAPHPALVKHRVVTDMQLPAFLESAIARKLSAARELIQRDLLAQMRERPVFDKPGALGEWLRLHCAGLEHEVFVVIYLDAQHRLIGIEQLFRGTLTQTSVYPREVVKASLAHNAATVVFAHNHPSGSTEPSRADECLTTTLKTALNLVDIRVLDHFIVAGTQHYSFAEHGLI